MRLDGELCSLGLGDMVTSTEAANPFATTSEPTFLPDLLRVAQSGAVGVFCLLDWSTNTNADGEECIELQIANVGDCSAVLFSASSENSSGFCSCLCKRNAQKLLVFHGFSVEI